MIVQPSVSIPAQRQDAGSNRFAVGRPLTAYFTLGNGGWPSASLPGKPVPASDSHSGKFSDPAENEVVLTERQLECLSWISQGKSSTDIGAILNISGRTVDYHVGEICQRLKVRTRMQAVAYAVSRGWLSA